MLSDAFYNWVVIQFTTGDDNLRSNSELTADVYRQDLTAIAADVSLHPQDGGTWDNWTVSPRIGFQVQPVKLHDLARIDVVLRSHNAVLQNDDKWQVAQVLVQLQELPSGNITTWTDQDVRDNQFVLSRHGGKSNVMWVWKDGLAHPS